MRDASRPDDRWAAGLQALAGDRPVVIVEDPDATKPEPAPAGSLVVLSAALERMAAEQRPAVARALGGADAVLLCPPAGAGVRAVSPQCLPEWVAAFAAEGLWRVPGAALGWLTSWGVLLERAPLDPAGLALRYERLLLAATGQRRADADTARVLALTDRVIGLEAELAEAAYRRDQAQLERDATVEAERATAAALRSATAALDAMRASASWRIGQGVVGPLRRAAGSVRRRGAPGS
ncbi:hypothetical protein K6U06_14410 [Acidiferrimicrobium sp. IK]|uniref:hypothetical protein n=1 Tax=Acidiferrimicrobium sp. IK TaxID=2871700 RepID=UPI0021CAF808|nr:hypothetical protein [Acidiferrimicrobium sp. IK]MCU4185558.1 hypothetical protein [Acidiferrimicrobium sp. IK]